METTTRTKGHMTTPQLTGLRFNRLTVIRRASNSKQGAARWNCACDCGGSTISSTTDLKRGRANSCGCFQKERTSRSAKSHGESKTKIYAIWSGMLTRCENPNYHRYKDYGGRGISVCLEWHSFERFKHDMGDRPSKLHTLGRVDNNGPYSKENCRWESRTQQAGNRRSNRLITHNGITMIMKEWAKSIGMSMTGLSDRLSNGMDIETALTTPKRKNQNDRTN